MLTVCRAGRNQGPILCVLCTLREILCRPARSIACKVVLCLRQANHVGQLRNIAQRPGGDALVDGKGLHSGEHDPKVFQTQIVDRDPQRFRCGRGLLKPREIIMSPLQPSFFGAELRIFVDLGSRRRAAVGNILVGWALLPVTGRNTGQEMPVLRVR